MEAHEHSAFSFLTEATSQMCPGTIHGCHYWTSWCEPQKASGHCRVASCRVKSSELHSCILHCTARRTPLAARFSSVVVTSVPCHFKQPSRFIKIPSIAGHVIWYASLTLARYINAYQCHCSIPIVYPLKVVWSLTFRWQMANGRGSSNASACLGLSFSWLHEKKTDETDIVEVHIEGETEVATSLETVHWADSDNHITVDDRLVRVDNLGEFVGVSVSFPWENYRSRSSTASVSWNLCWIQKVQNSSTSKPWQIGDYKICSRLCVDAWL